MKIMAGIKPLIFIGVYLFSPICCLQETSRDARFSIFQIIKFENAPCQGGTRNGTCFTAAECENVGGNEDGECADGFGVCCTTIISAGASTSLNQSYIVESAPATGTYTICPCSADVCRIRFDFTAFALDGPVASDTQGGAVAAPNAAGVGINSGQATGDCSTDTFSISGSGGSGTPVICGVNTGQHAFVDSDGMSCSQVSVGVAGNTATRSLDIMVTQFKCGEEMGGPSGCLQWFTSPAGSVSSFNFPNNPGANVASTVTHLSSQKYSICIRQPAGTTLICYISCVSLNGVAATVNMPATMQASFGLSVSPAAAAAKSDIGSLCTSDYITIRGGDVIANLASGNVGNTGTNSRFCGRELNTAGGAIGVAGAGPSICTNSVPYQIGVNFDEDEVSAVVGNMADMHEAELAPGGIIGFCLDYTTT